MAKARFRWVDSESVWRRQQIQWAAAVSKREHQDGSVVRVKDCKRKFGLGKDEGKATWAGGGKIRKRCEEQKPLCLGFRWVHLA